MDNELRCGEEESDDEDEQVGHQLLQVHPLPLVREVFPNDVIWRWRVPVHDRISKESRDCNIYQTLHLSGLMATVEWGGLNLRVELNINFKRERKKIIPLEVEYRVLVVPEDGSGVVDVLKSHKSLKKREEKSWLHCIAICQLPFRGVTSALFHTLASPFPLSLHCSSDT